ncbi:MAG: M48 family metalloprotease [Alphaproteobacteria bacterium]
MKARLCFLLAALLVTGAQAQFKLEDLGNLAKSQKLPGNVGDVLGKVQEYAGPQSADDEAASGNAIAATVLGAAPVWRNAKVQSYVNLVGRGLASHVERKDVTWRFAVLDTPSVNAMAFPGGIVVVTRGLYRLLASEDELAGVLAHEIAHVNRKHQWKVIQKQKLIALAGNAVTKGNSDRNLQMVSDLGTRLLARGLDKNSEFEADRDGMVIAARAGYDSSALISVMGRLKALPNNADTALLFSTHPSPDDRIEAMTEAATTSLEAAAVPSPAAARIKTAQ